MHSTHKVFLHNPPLEDRKWASEPQTDVLKNKKQYQQVANEASHVHPAVLGLIKVAEKGQCSLSAVILTIRQQQQQYQFTTSLLCALKASSSFWQTICLGHRCTVNQESGRCYVVFIISCKNLLKNLLLQIDETVILSTLEAEKK